ncbi:TonB-dependent receptor [Rhodoferax sp.]|uniref:TonB-dependent receptor plug domain-containing protein n=1 Tax=Rhodoferax sp. TaxID=50421 RepID=UPI0025F1099E|nr:TonB-dependent receptor [Rhodoferax sp.]
MKNLSPVVRSGVSVSVGLVWLMASHGLSAQTDKGVSEDDFLQDMPIVLSVSRMPQRLDETPGAVTILDRNFIRSSGARDVPDLLRLVPGFQSSMSFEADAPQVSYHGVFGNYSGRIQVLLDGRSVYSSYFAGSVAPGLMSVALEDIERIEVLRGSNSVAYGARAMLGVVNIITRHTSATLGVSAKISRGENGIQDTQLGLGWRAGEVGMRLGIDEQGDDGLVGSNGHNRVRRVNFRSDWQASDTTNLALRLGWTTIDAGRGSVGVVTKPLRDTSYDSSFVQADWNKVLSPDQDLAVSYSHSREKSHDRAPFTPVPGLYLDSSGSASNDSLTAQHTVRLNEALRAVWGAEFRRESVTSLPLYNTTEPLVTDFSRLFAHAEWRMRPDLLLNAGIMAEHSSVSGSSLAPRLMLNWHVAPGQTLRAGMARSFRPPSRFETDGDVRRILPNGKLLQVDVLARGNIDSEAVRTRELGYFGTFSWLNSSLDVRIFDESLTGLSQRLPYPLPPGTSLVPSKPADYINGDSFTLRGVEFQWQGRPWAGAQLNFSQTFANVLFPSPPTRPQLAESMPESASTLLLVQQLPFDLQFSVSHQYSKPFRLQSDEFKQYVNRTDWRLAKTLRYGRRTGELALTVQNQGQPYADFDESFLFERRAFVTLRLDN